MKIVHNNCTRTLCLKNRGVKLFAITLLLTHCENFFSLLETIMN